MYCLSLDKALNLTINYNGLSDSLGILKPRVSSYSQRNLLLSKASYVCTKSHNIEVGCSFENGTFGCFSDCGPNIGFDKKLGGSNDDELPFTPPTCMRDVGTTVHQTKVQEICESATGY